MNYYHSGAYGDLVYGLPALRAAPKGTLWLDHHRKQHGDRTALFYEPMKRLVDQLPYISEVRGAAAFEDVPEPRLNLDGFRHHFRVNQIGLEMAHALFLGVELSLSPWIEVEPWNPCADVFIVFNLTTRYRAIRRRVDWRGVRAGLREYHQVFVGLEAEYSIFIRETGPIDWVRTEDMLQVARVIGACEQFFGNASACLAIAQGMGKSHWIEISAGTRHVALGLPGQHILNEGE